jgi:uncharacterized protein
MTYIRDMSDPARPRAATVELCPTCGKPAADAFRPFCSRRCADVDLHRWLAGVYAVPDDGGQTTEDGGEMTDDEGEMTEDGAPVTEDR